MPNQLKGRCVVVTGSASGIGRAIAVHFAKAGAELFLLDLSSTDSVVKEIQDLGGKASGFSCDVSNQVDVIKIIDGIAAKNRLDVLVNCAGIAHVGKLGTTSVSDFEKLFNVNVKGVYNAMYASMPHMTKQGGGVILNMASVAGSVGIPDRFAYSMTKGAVLSMTLSVARDYVNEGIRCNSISPARIHTPFVDGFLAKNYPGKEKEMYETLSKTQPIGRMGKPNEVAQLALFLCSDESSFITGTDYPIDGGFIKLK